MIQHRYSRSSIRSTTHLFKPVLATGINFGCSNLRSARRPELVSSIASRIAIGTEDIESVGVHKSSPLIVEVGKIALLVCWFWCAIGINFCFDSLNAIVSYSDTDI